MEKDLASSLDCLRSKARVHAVARVLAMSGSHGDSELTRIQAHAQAIASTSCKTVADLASWILGEGASQGLDVYSLHVLKKAFEAARGGGASLAIPNPPPLAGPAASAMRLLSFDALRRARGTLEDFTQFYLPLHGLKDRDFFRWWHVLVYAEACIYQLDEDNEAKCFARLTDVAGAPAGGRGGGGGGSGGAPADVPVIECPCGAGPTSMLTARTERNNGRQFFRCPNGPNGKCSFFQWADEPPSPAKAGGAAKGPSHVTTSAHEATDVEQALYAILHVHGLVSSRVAEELASGQRYWALERKLCTAMASLQAVSLEDVMEASQRKSFDYRVLHAILCQLCGEVPSEALLRFLHVDECLTDIADDLLDYEKDVHGNAFNVLRGVVHATRRDGSAAALELASRIGEMEEEHEALLQALPIEQRQVYCANRAAAMAKPGADKWTFPAQIFCPADEARYRLECALSEEQQDNESDLDAGKPSAGFEVAACDAKEHTVPTASWRAHEKSKRQRTGTLC